MRKLGPEETRSLKKPGFSRNPVSSGRFMRTTLSTHRVDSLGDALKTVEHRIAQRARELFRGSTQWVGGSLDHWPAAERQTIWRPPIEINQTADEVLVEIAVAGVPPEHLDIRVTSDALLIQADTEHAHLAGPRTVELREFQPGRLFGIVRWPAAVDPDSVRAEYRYGFVHIRAALAAGRRPRGIDVHGARTGRASHGRHAHKEA